MDRTPNFSLILPEEIHEIRRIWLTERGDWQDSIPQIYRENTDTDLQWISDDTGVFSSKEGLILHEVCEKYDLPEMLVQKLLDAERQTTGMNKRSSIFQRINNILSEEWRSEDEVKLQVVEELSDRNIVSRKVKDEVMKGSLFNNIADEQ